MLWKQILVKNPVTTGRGHSIRFSHDGYEFTISFLTLSNHGIYSPEDLKNKIIIFDQSKELKSSEDGRYRKWLRINSGNIIEIISGESDEDVNINFDFLKRKEFQLDEDDDFENEDFEEEENYDDHFAEDDEILKTRDQCQLTSKIDFSQIYNSIESYKIKENLEEMDAVDKLIEKSIKLTPSKYKNNKIRKKKNYYSFNMLFHLAHEQLVQFLNGELDCIRISFPKKIKLPQEAKNDNDKIIEFLDKEKLLEYSTKTNIEHFRKNKITTDEFLQQIEKNRNNNFSSLKDIQKEANKIKNETGVNALVIAWPYIKGKTAQGTIFHCPIAYTNIEIQESINYFEIVRLSNFQINTYPILKNYSERKSFVNKINPEFTDLKDCLIEFFKHGIKILSPENNEFVDYSYIDPKNNTEFNSWTNDFFRLSNEVSLLIKEHDEFINYDLREIKSEYGFFDIPEKTSTLINEEEENRERHYCLDLDNSKVTAIEKSMEKSTVIFGPPGTGKSESITAIITEIIKKSKNSIFVAEKNTAINVVESNLKKINFDDFMINLNNNSKMQFQEKFNNQINLVFQPNNFDIPEDTLTSKNFAERWLKEIKINKEFYKIIDHKNAKFVFEFIVWFNEITLSANVSNIKDLINKIIKCKDDEINQEKYYSDLVPQINNKSEDNNKLNEEIKKQELHIAGTLENKVTRLSDSLKEVQKTILASSEKLKTDLLDLTNKLEKAKDSSKINKEEIEKSNKILLDELKKYLENSDLIEKYIDVYNEREFESISKINNIDEFFIFIKNKKPLMIKSKVKKNLVDLKKLMNEIKDRWNKYIDNKNKIKALSSEYLQLEEWIKEIPLFDLNKENYDVLEKDNNELKKAHFQECSNSLKSLKESKKKIKDVYNQKHFFASLLEDEKQNYLKTLELDKYDFLGNELVDSILAIRKDYDKMSDQINELEKLQKDLNLINIDEINKNVSWLKKQNLENLEILENDIKIQEIIDFYLLNKEQLDISKNIKWKNFKKWKKKELNNIIHAIKIEWSKGVKDKYNNDEEFKNRLDVLKKYITNKLDKRNVSINSIFQTPESLEVLKVIFPCIAMDPETASRILPIDKNIFDYGIFDEASQIRLHKAIPVLHRSKQVIVAGDDKQLGPIDLFSQIEDEENDALSFDEENDFNNKTLLNFAKDKYQNFSLLTHYRSRAKELIEFSNKKFYKNKIQTEDSPLARYDGKKPIILEDINGRWENRTNLQEAKRVVELAKYYLIEQGKTLGIITFNENQEQLINQLLVEDNQLRPFLSNFDKLFVKPIKNVQGDEKEVIIFSIAYGLDDKTGRYVKNYGNFSKEKINVAITRSKLRMHVLKSIPSSEISRNNEDYRIFAEWLEFIESKSTEPDNIVNHENKFRSEFEEDYFNLLSELLPKHIKPLANYKSGNKEIDIVLYNTETNQFVGAIELDGIRHHSSTEQILSDFDRQTFLESLGWNFVRVSPIDFYNNRKRCIIEDLSKHDILI